MPLFQNPQLPGPVGFHISLAPGAHDGGGGGGGAHIGAGPHGPAPVGKLWPAGPCQSWHLPQSQL